MRPVLPVWQWLAALSALVKVRVVTERAAVRRSA